MNRDQFVQKRARYETRNDEGVPVPGRGEHPQPPQILSLEPSGFSLLIDGRPVFLPFREYPAFTGAAIDKLRRIQRTGGNQLYWPEFDVRLSLSDLRREGAA